MKGNLSDNDHGLRAYHFGNFYLSSIQQGIQAHHAGIALALKYRMGDDSAAQMVWEWAPSPIVYCLNGGNNKTMQEIRQLFSSANNPYPWSDFFEDYDSLHNILTNVAIIVPEKIWGALDKWRGVFKHFQTPYGNYPLNFEEFVGCIREEQYWAENSEQKLGLGSIAREFVDHEKEVGKYTLWESQLVDFIRGFRLAQ